jgi:hypothetical protein
VAPYCRTSLTDPAAANGTLVRPFCNLSSNANARSHDATRFIVYAHNTAARADRQHAAVLAGDEVVGVFGDYPPAQGSVGDVIAR